MEKIDFVIPWVDGNDPKWLEERSKYEINRGDDNRDIRYRDFDLLKYWFRGVEKHAGWVNRIYFITYGHIPKWLNTNHPKLCIIKHDDYIPSQYLPTFNSHTIELNLHRISKLSEQFVYFNDDIFILRSLKPSDFFINGEICDCFVQTAITPQIGEFSSIICETTSIISKYFSKKDIGSLGLRKTFNICYRELLMRTLTTMPYKHLMGIYNAHICCPHKKSTFGLLWDLEFETLNSTCMHKFRAKTDVNQYLFRYWNLCKGDFTPKYPIGKYITLASDIESIIREINNKRNKVLTINDSVDAGSFEDKIKAINNCLNSLFSEKSSFEL